MVFGVRKFDLIVALYIFGIVTAELMGAKTFPLIHTSWLHLNATVAIFMMPLLFTLTDIVVEVHGRARARSMVFSGLAVVAMLIVYSWIATSLPPSTRYAPTESAYDTIFRASIQIAIASLMAFAISEFLDVLIFSKLRERMGSHGLWLRNNVSNFASQLIDSTVFIVIAFYSFNQTITSNLSFMIGLIIPYWLLRCALSVAETPLAYLGVWWLKDDVDAPKNKK